jgi:hypothetical protein
MRKHILASIPIMLLITLLLSSASLAAGNEGPWVAYFSYDVPSGTLAEGDHTLYYEFTWTQPSPGYSKHGPTTLSISDGAPVYQGFVLLRPVNAWARVLGSGDEQCEYIYEVHPDQPMRFHVGWYNDSPMTYPEARAHFESMTVTVQWDSESPVQLVRHEITPFSWERWPRQVCSWTMRQ